MTSVVEKGEMRHAPRPPAEGVFNRLILRRMAVSAAVIGAYRVLIDAGWSVHASRNAVVALMVLFENVMIFNSRSETESSFRIGVRGNPLLMVGTLAALGIHLAAMHWAPTPDLLQAAPLPAHTWAWTILIAAGMLAAVELDKALSKQRHRNPSDQPVRHHIRLGPRTQIHRTGQP